MMPVSEPAPRVGCDVKIPLCMRSCTRKSPDVDAARSGPLLSCVDIYIFLREAYVFIFFIWGKNQKISEDCPSTAGDVGYSLP